MRLINKQVFKKHIFYWDGWDRLALILDWAGEGIK